MTKSLLVVVGVIIGIVISTAIGDGRTRREVFEIGNGVEIAECLPGQVRHGESLYYIGRLANRRQFVNGSPVHVIEYDEHGHVVRELKEGEGFELREVE